MGDLNSPDRRPDLGGEVWPDGDLPAQMGGAFSSLPPGVSNFRLPIDLPQLWDTVVVKADRPGHPDHGKDLVRIRVKFSREHPLVVVDGPHKDETLTATMTNNPRPRGRKDNPQTPWISDLMYLLDVSLGDKSRPTNPDVLKAAINKHAGRVIRLEHGLSAQCRPDKVRYIEVSNGNGTSSVMQDPSGVQGCGLRYYTKDFKNPDAKGDQPPYDEQIECDCHAILRGFAQVERFLPPQGQGAAMAVGSTR